MRVKRKKGSPLFLYSSKKSICHKGRNPASKKNPIKIIRDHLGTLWSVLTHKGPRGSFKASPRCALIVCFSKEWNNPRSNQTVDPPANNWRWKSEKRSRVRMIDKNKKKKINVPLSSTAVAAGPKSSINGSYRILLPAKWVAASWLHMSTHDRWSSLTELDVKALKFPRPSLHHQAWHHPWYKYQ